MVASSAWDLLGEIDEVGDRFERIVDLVGDGGGQPSGRRQLFSAPQLFFGQQLIVNIHNHAHPFLHFAGIILHGHRAHHAMAVGLRRCVPHTPAEYVRGYFFGTPEDFLHQSLTILGMQRLCPSVVARFFPGLAAVSGPCRLRLNESSCGIGGPGERAGGFDERPIARFAQAQLAKELSVLDGGGCPCGQILGQVQIFLLEVALAAIREEMHDADYAIPAFEGNHDGRDDGKTLYPGEMLLIFGSTGEGLFRE